MVDCHVACELLAMTVVGWLFATALQRLGEGG